MKIFVPKLKSRFDLYDLNNCDSPESLTLFSRPEEYYNACPIAGRPENVSYFCVSSWGDVIHIQVILRPLDANSRLMNASVRFKMNLNRSPERCFEIVQNDILDIEESKDRFGNVIRYRIGSFLFEQPRPFAGTRIVFRGFLQDKKTGSRIFTKLHLFANAIGQVIDNLTNLNVEFMKAQFSKDTAIMCEDSFEQWIQMKGMLELEDTQELREIYFWGISRKSFETDSSMNHLLAWNHRGMGIHMMVKDSKLYGNVNIGIGNCFPLNEKPATFQPEMLENVQLLTDFTVDLKDLSKSYSLEFGLKDKLKDFGNNLSTLPLKLKGHNGYCLIWKEDFESGIVCNPSNSLRIPKEISPNAENNVVSFEDPISRIESLTGGKGSSLAILNDFSKQSSIKFQVPEATVVTSEAYKSFLNFYPSLKIDVQEFPKRILECRGNQNQIKTECENMENTFKKNSLSDPLIQVLKKKMIQIFGEDFEGKANRFAVRSSAVGEDSKEMSAAGQMTTFLGISGFDSVCQSVISCWASQFGQTAVEYKRGYGQSLNSPMAVVIQKMVPSEVAGVMFTCSPLDGNERFITITANYGLGESVVSGQVEPDTYTVKVDVDSESRKVLEIESVKIGAKKHAIHMEAQHATKTQEHSQEEQKARCLNDDQVLELAKIGLEVHNHYGNARDIEFGLSDGVWYPLQSRPVTNLGALNEWEVMHELDDGHFSENESFSRANVGEVFPGALSYMAFNITTRLWNVTTFKFTAKLAGLSMNRFNPFKTSLHTAYNTIFFPLTTPFGLMGRQTPTDDRSLVKGFEYSALGHRQTNTERIEEIFEKMPRTMTAFQKIKTAIHFQKRSFFAHSANRNCCEKFINYSINYNDQMSSKELFDKFCGEINVILESYDNHLSVSNTSMAYNAMLFSFLVSKLEGCDEKTILELFSKITSSVSDIFSAQVPTKLDEIVSSIPDPDHFKSLSDEDSLEYLKENCKQFVEFLEEYGHRGYNEFDMYARQWDDNPISLVRSLKSILKTNENPTDSLTQKSKNETNKTDLFEEYSLGFLARFLVNRFLIPKVHQGIRDRELGKNLLIRMNHQFRKLFHRISEKLVEEGKLPEKDLFFFMTFPEIRELIFFSPTNPLTIMNAKNRMRLQPKKCSFKWGEETNGYEMKPRNLGTDISVPIGTTKLPGVVISSGKIVARCCVAKTLDEAKNIQKGDILITYSTDIGWSPYFAALSGVVTEIGGLVSHGAVIAREYGLPCLVGVDDATEFFETGEMVFLDSSAGFIAKVDSSNPQDNNEQSGDLQQKS